MSEKIEKGDTVTIYFSVNALRNLTVLYIPVATGDSWHLKDGDGKLYYVQLFEYMEKIE